MWIPKQLLRDDVVTDLRQAGFDALQIEYLGWMSGTATALNNSMNPVKAAITVLSKALQPTKPNKKGDTRPMFDKFEARKKESVQPKTEIDLNAINQKFRKLEAWVDRVEAEHPSKPFNPFAENSADDEITDEE